MFNRLASIIVIFSFLSIALLFSGYVPPTVTLFDQTELPMPKIYTEADMMEADMMRLSPQIEEILETAPIVKVTVNTGIDGKQLKCLQENIFFESRNQSIVGQLLVGVVTLSRTSEERYPDTICEVVFQNKQFSWTNKGRKKPNLDNIIEREAWKRAGTLAKIMIDLGLEKYSSGVTHYHTTSIRPKWSKSDKLKPIFVIDDHIFYSENI